MMTAFVFKFRWLYWGVAALLLVNFFHPGLARVRSRLARSLENHFLLWLGSLCALFFTIGLAAKVSQLWTLQLHGMDFWLFEDMTAQLLKGGAMLTRFAPQSAGFVQHGAVHGMLSWFLTAPLAVLLEWVGGSLASSLVYGPLVLAGAAFFLGLFLREQLKGSTVETSGAVAAFGIAAAFLVSTQVGHILMYDVHPESAYPLAVFLWAWALQRDRPWLLFVATAFGMGIKEDSFLVFFPLTLWMTVIRSGRARMMALGSFLLALVLFVLQMKSIGAWAAGKWGPVVWEGQKVFIPQGPDLLKGVRWSSLKDIWQVLQLLVGQDGGWQGALTRAGRFLVSRPWLSLLVFCPGLLLQLRFWLLLGPLALAYSQLGRASLLNIYYSAPFLGTFWLLASDQTGMFGASRMISWFKSVMNRKFRAWNWAWSRSWNGAGNWSFLWLCLSPLVLGSGSPELHFPSSQVFALKNAVHSKWECLEARLSVLGATGVVGGNILAWVPRDRVFSQRLPQADSSGWEAVSFVLLSTSALPDEWSVHALEDWSVRSKALGFVEACVSPDSDFELKVWIKERH
jgi:hypothetical protein